MDKKKKDRIVLFSLLILTGIVSVLIFIQSASLEIIPPEESIYKEKLKTAIRISKYDIDLGIKELEGLNDLPKYTEYKKTYILAGLYERKNNFNQAIALYEKIIEKTYPLKERVMFHLADLYQKDGNDKAALKLFKKLISDFPNAPSCAQAMYYLAQIQLRLKFTNDAIKILTSLKNKFPKTQFGIATNFYLGENEYSNQNHEKAIEYWREYLKSSPDGRFGKEIATIITNNKNIPTKPYDFSLLGDVFFHQKDYINAAKYYKTGNTLKKYYELGYSLFRAGRKIEALPYLKEFAYTFPRSKNARWALYYAAQSLPHYMRKSFWNKITNEIPELAYYSIYKEGILEENKRKKEEILKSLIEKFPNGDFFLDAAWEIVWQKVKDKNYTEATELGEKYLKLPNNSKYLKTEPRIKICFWLGKIAEIAGNKSKAIEHYKEAQNSSFDNYYSIRAENRLSTLNGGQDNFWKLQNNLKYFKDLNRSIPEIIKSNTVKKYFGAAVSELIDLQQYNEAIELIGRYKFPTKRITAYLKALNSEYEISINLSNSIANEYNLSSKSYVWELAYPLYFWNHIINTCKKYPEIDPMIICGIIRQESRFEAKALSISNAYGLMQLIPPTARTVARQAGIRLISNEDLKKPEINIPLGVHYFNGLVNDLVNPLFAVASYNAGPNAVSSWIRKINNNDLDYFIEEIPYDQTKTYVKKVFSSYWTYLKIYG